MARKIVIVSGKGGVGKTTVTANLGYFLASLGKRVAVFDVDFSLNNLDVVLGVENKITYDVYDVLNGVCRPKQALTETDNKNLFLLTSNKVKDSARITGQNLKIIVESLSGIFDYLLLDCPAGVDEGFHRAVCCADEAIVVATNQTSSLRDADKVVSILKSYKPSKINLLLNRVRGDLVARDVALSPQDVEKLLKIPLLGVIPEDDEVFLRGVVRGKSASGKAFKLLAKNVNFGMAKIYDVTSKYYGIIGSLRRRLKKSV